VEEMTLSPVLRRVRANLIQDIAIVTNGEDELFDFILQGLRPNDLDTVVADTRELMARDPAGEIARDVWNAAPGDWGLVDGESANQFLEMLIRHATRRKAVLQRAAVR
jgi:glutamine synthetase adenylyltransferase